MKHVRCGVKELGLHPEDSKEGAYEGLVWTRPDLQISDHLGGSVENRERPPRRQV